MSGETYLESDCHGRKSRRQPLSSFSQGETTKLGSVPNGSVTRFDTRSFPGLSHLESIPTEPKSVQTGPARPDTTGAPRNGSARLGGLLVCGNCGWRMQVGYHAKDKLHDRCQRYAEHGMGQDVLVSQQVLKELELAALELTGIH